MTWLSRLFAWLRELFSNDSGFLKTPAGKEIKWRREDLPLNLCSQGLLHDDWLSVLSERVRLERALGADLFIASFSEGRVNVAYRQDDSDNATTELLWRDDGSIISATIYLPRSWPSAERRDAAVLHELLHALGLAHDRHPGSIMYPTVAHGGGTLWKSDIERLRKAYG